MAGFMSQSSDSSDRVEPGSPRPSDSLDMVDHENGSPRPSDSLGMVDHENGSPRPSDSLDMVDHENGSPSPSDSLDMVDHENGSPSPSDPWDMVDHENGSPRPSDPWDRVGPGSPASPSSSSLRVEPSSSSPFNAASEVTCCDVEEFSEHQSMTNSNDSEEVEQQRNGNSQDESGSDDFLLSSTLSAISNAESLEETILEQQTIVTEVVDPADPHSCADDAADCDQQGVRVFTPRRFSFVELLNSGNPPGFSNSDWGELAAPSDAAPSDTAGPSDAAANEVEQGAPDHNSNIDWEKWLNNREEPGDV